MPYYVHLRDEFHGKNDLFQLSRRMPADPLSISNSSRCISGNIFQSTVITENNIKIYLCVAVEVRVYFYAANQILSNILGH